MRLRDAYRQGAGCVERASVVSVHAAAFAVTAREDIQNEATAKRFAASTGPVAGSSGTVRKRAALMAIGLRFNFSTAVRERFA
jgi:hypothetical protein